MSAEPGRLCLSGRLGLSEAAALASMLRHGLATRDIEVDGTAIEEADAAILQVLAAARIHGASCGRALSVRLDADGQPAGLMRLLRLGPALGVVLAQDCHGSRNRNAMSENRDAP